jgi:hypothetical protein
LGSVSRSIQLFAEDGSKLVTSEYLIRFNGTKWHVALAVDTAAVRQQLIAVFAESIGVPPQFVEIVSLSIGSLIVRYAITRNASYAIPDSVILDIALKTNYADLESLYVNLTATVEDIFVMDAQLTISSVGQIDPDKPRCTLACIVGATVGTIAAVFVGLLILYLRRRRATDVGPPKLRHSEPFESTPSRPVGWLAADINWASVDFSPTDRRAVPRTSQPTDDAASYDEDAIVAEMSRYYLASPALSPMASRDSRLEKPFRGSSQSREATPLEVRPASLHDLYARSASSDRSSFILNLDLDADHDPFSQPHRTDISSRPVIRRPPPGRIRSEAHEPFSADLGLRVPPQTFAAPVNGVIGQSVATSHHRRPLPPVSSIRSIRLPAARRRADRTAAHTGGRSGQFAFRSDDVGAEVPYSRLHPQPPFPPTALRSGSMSLASRSVSHDELDRSDVGSQRWLTRTPSTTSEFVFERPFHDRHWFEASSPEAEESSTIA